MASVTGDDDSADRIVELADHVARSGASLDDSDTLRELIAASPGSASAAYARAARLSADALTDHERDRWSAVGATIAAAAAAADVTLGT